MYFFKSVWFEPKLEGPTNLTLHWSPFLLLLSIIFILTVPRTVITGDTLKNTHEFWSGGSHSGCSAFYDFMRNWSIYASGPDLLGKILISSVGSGLLHITSLISLYTYMQLVFNTYFLVNAKIDIVKCKLKKTAVSNTVLLSNHFTRLHRNSSNHHLRWRTSKQTYLCCPSLMSLQFIQLCNCASVKIPFKALFKAPWGISNLAALHGASSRYISLINRVNTKVFVE